MLLEKDINKYIPKLQGKKLLILGGASQHIKLVEAARELGVKSYDTDNLPITLAPAKKIADQAFDINLTEIDKLVELCRKLEIDGIASGWLDFPQIYYQRLCESLELPCYGTKKQFEIFTQKALFKKVCSNHGVDTPMEISTQNIEDMSEKLPFAIFVKPSDSAGSKGSSVVETKSELLLAIEQAKSVSNDGQAVVEQFIQNGKAFLVVYFFYNGKAYIQQLSDAFFGDKADGMDKINVAYRSPFSKADEYMKIANQKVVEMLTDLGVENGPVCMQGFLFHDNILFYDPGRRFPGGEYERIVKKYTGVDMMKGMVIFALTGKWPKEALPIGERPYLLGGKTTIRLQINVCAGKVKEERGFIEANSLPFLTYLAKYHSPGDIIQNTGNTHQRYAQAIIGADTTEELIKYVEKFYNMIDVIDNEGKSMIRSKLNVRELL